MEVITTCTHLKLNDSERKMLHTAVCAAYELASNNLRNPQAEVEPVWIRAGMSNRYELGKLLEFLSKLMDSL